MKSASQAFALSSVSESNIRQQIAQAFTDALDGEEIMPDNIFTFLMYIP